MVDPDVGNFGPWLRFHLPFTRTEYYNSDPGVESAGDFRERSGDDLLSYSQTTSYAHHQAGRTYHERWSPGRSAPATSTGTHRCRWRCGRSGSPPDLDRYNTAPAGHVHPVALTLTPQLGAAVGHIRALTVEASFDDGATWTRVPVQDGSALVRHPRGDGFVSLRAKASDTAGNTVEQTIIHAYRYG